MIGIVLPIAFHVIVVGGIICHQRSKRTEGARQPRLTMTYLGSIFYSPNAEVFFEAYSFVITACATVAYIIGTYATGVFKFENTYVEQMNAANGGSGLAAGQVRRRRGERRFVWCCATVCSVLCAVCCVLCAVCSVLCASDTGSTDYLTSILTHPLFVSPSLPLSRRGAEHAGRDDEAVKGGKRLEKPEPVLYKRRVGAEHVPYVR